MLCPTLVVFLWSRTELKLKVETPFQDSALNLFHCMSLKQLPGMVFKSLMKYAASLGAIELTCLLYPCANYLKYFKTCFVQGANFQFSHLHSPINKFCLNEVSTAQSKKQSGSEFISLNFMRNRAFL